MRFKKKFLQWRHSKGFGVHSPFAYRFVTDVLRPGNYAYYSYHDIFLFLEEKERISRGFLKQVRFLIRLMIFLKIKRVVVLSGEGRQAFVATSALQLTFEENPRLSDFSFKNSDIIISRGNKKEIPFLEEAVKAGSPVFVTNATKEAEDFMRRPIPKGLLLDAGHKLILIPRPEMEYVSYDMDLSERDCS